MRIHPFSHRGGSWSALPQVDSPQTLVIVFADPQLCLEPELWSGLADHFPQSKIAGCSTAGGIQADQVHDGSIEGAAVVFEKTELRTAQVDLTQREESFSTGQRLAEQLKADDLRAVFLLSDGLLVDGTDLAHGLSSALPAEVSISGGLAGDGSRFQTSWVIGRNGARTGCVLAVGFYGQSIHTSQGIKGGWTKFGVERLVTRSRGAVLYEIDGVPALQLYREYLGDKAAGLPATGLLFPMSIREPGSSETVVRTILNVNEADQSLTFAGTIPEGSRAQLMKANVEDLLEGAASAAQAAADEADRFTGDCLALAVSCVGRRLVLRARVEEELEATLNACGSDTTQIGFYSYGEIGATRGKPAQLHNQTMTMTLFRETVAT